MPPYYQAVANTRLVGRHVARFVLLLRDKFSLNLDDVHLIGHSLGAHISGYGGKETIKIAEAKIGRITGLDPAGPHFTNYPETVRLSPEDATFVDTVNCKTKILLFTKILMVAFLARFRW